jgi:hypothetical protein
MFPIATESPKWVGHGVVFKYDLSDIRKAARQGRLGAYSAGGRLTPLAAGAHGVAVPTPALTFAGVEPYEITDAGNNLLCTAGVTRLWNLATAQGATQAFDSTHTRIGVGNGTTAAAAGDTDFSAAAGSTNRQFNVVTGVGTVSTNTLQFSAVFASGVANFVWAEWGIDQGTANGTTVVAPLLNHAVPNSLGTKTSAAAWTFTVTLSLT